MQNSEASLGARGQLVELLHPSGTGVRRRGGMFRGMFCAGQLGADVPAQ